MNIKLLHITLILSLCAALAACCDQDVWVDENTEGKTPIELYAGWSDAEEGRATTRTVITDDESKPHNAFPANTSLYMLMQSEYIGDGAVQAPWVTRTIMFALPQSDPLKLYSETNYSESNEYSKFVKYWDDVYARDAAVSIVAVCTPGMGPNIPGQTNTKAWSIGNNTAFADQAWTHPAGGGGGSYPSISWPIGNNTQITNGKFLIDQSLMFDGVSYIKNQDLCFSNNLNDYSDKGAPHSDGRIKFNWTTRHFNEGKLIFYHALSKLTFRFKMGEGFTDAQFKFNAGTNVKLTNFYSQGTFNLAEGEFDNGTLKKANGVSGQNDPIERIWQRTGAELSQAEKDEFKYILDALVIPGTNMTTSDNAVTFAIYNNEYKLTMAQLYAAFTDAQKSEFFDSDKLKAGVHYVFTFTVGKTKIEKITAQLVPWEDVLADNIDPTNAHITLNLEERGSDLTSSDHFSFYRAADNIADSNPINDDHAVYNWITGYNTTGETPSYVAAASTKPAHWATTWYWDSNKHFYHFRALAKDNGTTKEAVSSASVNIDVNGDYYALTSNVAYDDILWGAPMKDVEPGNEMSDASTLKWNYGPTTNGFDGLDGATTHQIYKAIGPTEDPVKLILFHMMSDLTFKIKTTTGSDKVTLVDNTDSEHPVFTKVQLEGFFAGGKLLLGTGLVKTDGSITPTDRTAPEIARNGEESDYQIYKYGVVPQGLTNVQLRITTPDKNEYIVSLNNVKASTVTNNNIANPYQQESSKYLIDRWYPGFKYTYSFTLAKTGITNLTATIVDWETVTAADETVQIK